MSKAMILIADDDPDILRAVTARLHFAGYEVLSANDGKMATQLALDAAPDLAILDIGMPYNDGHAVAQHMLASSDTKNTPINLSDRSYFRGRYVESLYSGDQPLYDQAIQIR